MSLSGTDHPCKPSRQLVAADVVADVVAADVVLADIIVADVAAKV
jgi:hypothetical protein